jgi:hypothetical protein
MSTVAIEYDYPRVMSVAVTEDSIAASLSDGRTISVPLAWSWRLSEATSGAARALRTDWFRGKACIGRSR